MKPSLARFDEIFNGGAGADTLIGGGGNDVFIWGSGSFGDIIEGGAGDEDTIQLVGSDLTCVPGIEDYLLRLAMATPKLALSN